MPHIYFITHPEVNIDPAVPVPQWQLSDEGRARATLMLKQPWINEINLLYSSEELKAHQTAEIISGHLNLEVHVSSKLGEVDRSSTGYLEQKELEKTLKQFFLIPDKSIAGWEMANDAQNRIVKCVKDIIEINPNSKIAIVSHGMVGGLLMCFIKNVPIHKRYMQRDLGSYFIFDPEGNEIVQEWRRIDPA